MGLPPRLRTALVRTFAVAAAASCLAGALWGGLYLLQRAPEMSRAHAATESLYLSQDEPALAAVLGQEVDSFAVELFLQTGSGPVTPSALSRASKVVTGSLASEGLEAVVQGEPMGESMALIRLSLLAGEECVEVPLVRDVSGIFVEDGTPSVCAAEESGSSPEVAGAS